MTPEQQRLESRALSAAFKPGQFVTAQNGLIYLIMAVRPLDNFRSFSYTVRRLRDGVPCGPQREIAECNLEPMS